MSFWEIFAVFFNVTYVYEIFYEKELSAAVPFSECKLRKNSEN